MIKEYFRPKTITEAMGLINRQDGEVIPIGGGTNISKKHNGDFCVVDLQDLGLNRIKHKGNTLTVGATARLEEVRQTLEFNPIWDRAFKVDAGLHVRNAATIGGLLKTAGGKSLVLLLLLSIDAKLVCLPENELVQIGEWLAARENWRGLITEIQLPTNVRLTAEWVSASQMSYPEISLAMAIWPSNRKRIVVSGCTKTPRLVADGVDDEVMCESIDIACSHYINQKNHNPKYFKATIPILCKRLYKQLDDRGESHEN